MTIKDTNRPPTCFFDRYEADDDFLKTLTCFNCPINPHLCGYKMIVLKKGMDVDTLYYDGLDEIEAMIPPSGYRCMKCGGIFSRSDVIMVDGVTGKPFKDGELLDGKIGKFVCRKCLKSNI